MKSTLERVYGTYKFADISENENSVLYRMEDDSGCGTMEFYQVLPGVQIAYNELRMNTCFQKVEPPKGFLEIDYCRKGCYEMEIDREKLVFLGEGMLSVVQLDSQVFTGSRIPLNEYQGISILIEMEKVQPVLTREFASAGIRLEDLAQSLRLMYQPFLVEPEREIDRIFQDLEQERERKDPAHFWLKTVELLLYLKDVRKETLRQPHTFSTTMEEGTRKIYDYLRQHPGEKRTIPQLAAEFHLAETSMKRCFKYLTGKSIGAFMRKQRMEQAAKLLQAREMSVGEIAEAVGYENQSKFSAAFKAIYGETPLAYRHSLRKF